MFELHRDIVKSIGREPKITTQGNGSLLIETSTPEETVRNFKSLAASKGKLLTAVLMPH